MKVFYIGVFTAIAAFASISTAFSKDMAGESAYARVMRTRTLRCGYFIEAPITQKNLQTGALEGLVVDLTESLAKDLGLKVEWAEEINASTMIEGLNTNRYDALCASIWNITSRAGLMEHSIPYLYTPVGAYVRADDSRFDKGLSAVNEPGMIVAGVDGSGETLLAAKAFPKAKQVTLPQFSSFPDLFLNVQSKKADMTFTNLPIFQDYQAKNPGKLKMAGLLTVMGNSFAFRQGETGLKNMFDTALMTYVDSGELDTIIDKWEKSPHSFYRPEKPYRKN